MKRDIFNNGPIEKVQQGCIFSGGIAHNYKNHSVYGLIITPRCDIEQNKVEIIHYLPIIKYSDWKDFDLVKLYQFEILKNKRKTLIEQIKSKQLPEHILDIKYRISSSELATSLKGKGVSVNFQEDLISYWELHDIENCRNSITKWNNYNSRLSDLANGKNERFILLEHWDNEKEDFCVISLTEIRHLRLSTAHTLLSGLRANCVDEEKDELQFQTNNTSVYKIQASLKSPYLEYICQRMTNAFFRIGIEDWMIDVTNKLKTI